MDNISIFWFRRDLRLNDNHGLFEALSNNTNVLPIFIFDKNILDKLPKNDARVNFIHTQLQKINQQLQEVNSSIHVFYGNPIDIYQELLKKHNINSVYTNRDYEPYASERDKAILELLEKNKISFKSFKDQVIFEENEITKDDGNPYKVYTPYSKKWLSTFTPEHAKPYSSEKLMRNFVKTN